MSTGKGESSKDTNEKGYPEELPEPFTNVINEIYDKMNVATEPLREAYKVWGKPLPQILDEMDENIRAAALAARKAEEAARAAKEAAGAGTKAAVEAEKRAQEAKKAGQIAAKTALKAAADAARKAEETAKAARLAAQKAKIKAEESDKGAKAAVEAFRKAAEEAAKKAQEASNAARAVSEESTLKIVKEAAEAKKIIGSLREYNASLLGRIKSLEGRLTIVEASLLSEKVIILRKISKEDAEKEIRKIFSEGKTLYYSDIAERLNLDLQLVVKICNQLQKRGEIKIDDNALQSR
ncbi:MAG: hypothetical protein JXA17_01435 [Dehalococcoidales bacterium]|nr:hypothetical protein [Dehalococcoidales bacterium]